MSAERIAMLACALCIAGAAAAGNEGALDVEFLEYLGEWEEADDDWLLFDEAGPTIASEQDEPADKEAETPEKEDES